MSATQIEDVSLADLDLDPTIACEVDQCESHNQLPATMYIRNRQCRCVFLCCRACTMHHLAQLTAFGNVVKNWSCARCGKMTPGRLDAITEIGPL